MKKIIALLALTGLIISCNTTSHKKEEQTTDSKTLHFVAKEYHDSSDMGAAINVVIPFAEGDTDGAKAINNKIYDVVRSIIGSEESKATDYESLLSTFISDYEFFKKDEPTSAIGWEASVESSVELNKTNLINIRIDAYTFTGGAHGNPVSVSLLLDPTTGKEVALTEIIKDVAIFTKIAEAKFRETYELADDDAINSNGFSFENDTFALPATIFFTENRIELYYNHYEIAAYAMGPQEVFISYDEVKDLLAFEL